MIVTIEFSPTEKIVTKLETLLKLPFFVTIDAYHDVAADSLTIFIDRDYRVFREVWKSLLGYVVIEDDIYNRELSYLKVNTYEPLNKLELNVGGVIVWTSTKTIWEYELEFVDDAIECYLHKLNEWRYAHRHIKLDDFSGASLSGTYFTGMPCEMSGDVMLTITYTIRGIRGATIDNRERFMLDIIKHIQLLDEDGGWAQSEYDISTLIALAKVHGHELTSNSYFRDGSFNLHIPVCAAIADKVGIVEIQTGSSKYTAGDVNIHGTFSCTTKPLDNLQTLIPFVLKNNIMYEWNSIQDNYHDETYEYAFVIINSTDIETIKSPRLPESIWKKEIRHGRTIFTLTSGKLGKNINIKNCGGHCMVDIVKLLDHRREY